MTDLRNAIELRFGTIDQILAEAKAYDALRLARVCRVCDQPVPTNEPQCRPCKRDYQNVRAAKRREGR